MYMINGIRENNLNTVRNYLHIHFDRKQTATIINLLNKNGHITTKSIVDGRTIFIETIDKSSI